MSQTLDNLSYTWNNAGTTFTGIKYNVTDTASAAGSLLMDLQVGGVSLFNVRKTGAAQAQGLIIGNDGNNKASVWSSNATHIVFRTAEFVSQVNMNASGLHIGTAAGFFSFNGGYGNSGGGDLQLHRDAANTLAQRNATNAQEFRLYNTYTDSSNYERAMFKWSSNVLQIGTEKAGTGTARDLALVSSTNNYKFGAGTLKPSLTVNGDQLELGASGYRFLSLYGSSTRTFEVGTTHACHLVTSVLSTGPTLSVNKTMSFELTSDTQLKILVRGSDGTTRSVSLTLA